MGQVPFPPPPLPPAMQKVICEYCGRVNTRDMRTCRGCGAYLKTERPAPNVTAYPEGTGLFERISKLFKK